MEITKEEFLKAVEVVESYYKQVNYHIQEIKDRLELGNSTLKKGDFIVFEKNRTSTITIGKEYQITKVSYTTKKYNSPYFADETYLEFFEIITDDGKVKQYNRRNNGVEYYRSK